MSIKKGGVKVGQEGSLKKKQYETYKAEKEAQLNKAKRLQKTYEGASPSIKADLDKKFEGVFDPKDMVASSRRDAAKTYYASGGREMDTRVEAKDGGPMKCAQIKGWGKARKR